MTDQETALRELRAKGTDASKLRELIGFAADAMAKRAGSVKAHVLADLEAALIYGVEVTPGNGHGTALAAMSTRSAQQTSASRRRSWRRSMWAALLGAQMIGAEVMELIQRYASV